MQRAHAHFELREGGLLMKPMGRAELKVGGGFTGEAVFLQDGDVLTIGKLQLMLVLFDAPQEEEEEDQWFEVEPGVAPEDGDADEPYERQHEVPYARPLPDERSVRPSKRARQVPVTLDGQFVEVPGDQLRQRPAKRVRQIPVTLDGQFIETPSDQSRQGSLKRGRKAAAKFDLPFDPMPVAKRARVAPDGGEARTHGAPARRVKGRRV
jgi:hypothetical protein